MTCTKPALNELGDLLPFLCCTYFAGVPVVASADGNLYVLNTSGETLQKNIKAHDGEISSLYASDESKQLASGGKDGMIRIWNPNFDCLRELSLESILSYRGGRVRSLQISPDSNILLIGTRASEIVEVNIRSGTLASA